MNKRLVKYCILVIICIIVYLVIYNYTNQINNLSSNTYKKTQLYTSKRSDFVKQYIETLKNKKYAEGFNMLSANTKESFNNDLNKYTEYIKEKVKKMNQKDNGTLNNILSEVYLKSQNVTKYDIISKEFSYRDGTPEFNYKVYQEEFSVFDKFELIEFAPNEFAISLK